MWQTHNEATILGKIKSLVTLTNVVRFGWNQWSICAHWSSEQIDVQIIGLSLENALQRTPQILNGANKKSLSYIKFVSHTPYVITNNKANDNDPLSTTMFLWGKFNVTLCSCGFVITFLIFVYSLEERAYSSRSPLSSRPVDCKN